MSEKYTIAVDGPVGAGKSTLARLVAKKLNIVYVDTGAMYRSVGLHMLRNGVDLADGTSVVALLPEVELDVKIVDGVQQIFLNGEDVSDLIRTPEISMAASNVSKIAEVREKLVDLQRKLADRVSVIMDGRDIGTVVLPNASTKIYLTASIDVRATRRYKELIAKGQDVSYDEVKADIIKSDDNDMNRDVSPLRPADDSVTLDTSDMTLDEAVDAIIEIASKNV